MQNNVEDRSRVLVFIVSFNAEAFIRQVLDRIPHRVWENERYEIEVLVIDDRSSDQTFYQAVGYSRENSDRKIKVLSNPVNQGYGGNQKLGYQYAINQGFDIVVLLHGDGQYDPEYLDQMIFPLLNDDADVVLGSRMIRRLDALRGGMPLYKWLGNQALTSIQNKLLGTSLAEFHTGYRAYSSKALAKIPFEYNANGFDFDTDILIQLIDNHQRIREIAIPTYYGDEISHVNVWRYGTDILRTTLHSRIVKLNLLYDRRFDYTQKFETYTMKLGYPSSHQFAIDQIQNGNLVLDLGCGPGYMAQELSNRGAGVFSIDKHITSLTADHSILSIEADIETCEPNKIPTNVDYVLMLDIIEHLKEPEELMLRLRSRLGRENAPKFLITTGNVAFLIIRFSLLLGLFNYGKKGILDQDHKRLFTFGSLVKLLKSTGYEILTIQGIPAPYPLAISNRWISRLLISINNFFIRLSRGLFSYQIAIIAQPRPMIEQLLEHARITSERMMIHSQQDE